MYVLHDDENNIVKFPYSLRQLRRDNRNVAFPASPSVSKLAEFNVAKVIVEGEIAHDPATEYLAQAEQPFYNDGTWYLAQEKHAYPLETQRRKLLERVNTNRDAAFWANIPHGDSAIQFRGPGDQSNLTNLYQHAKNGNDVQVILEDNSIETIAAADFTALMETALAGKSAIRLAARQIKNNLAAAGTKEDLQAVDLGDFA